MTPSYGGLRRSKPRTRPTTHLCCRSPSPQRYHPASLLPPAHCGMRAQLGCITPWMIAPAEFSEVCAPLAAPCRAPPVCPPWPLDHLAAPAVPPGACSDPLHASLWPGGAQAPCTAPRHCLHAEQLLQLQRPEGVPCHCHAPPPIFVSLRVPAPPPQTAPALAAALNHPAACS